MAGRGIEAHAALCAVRLLSAAGIFGNPACVYAGKEIWLASDRRLSCVIHDPRCKRAYRLICREICAVRRNEAMAFFLKAEVRRLKINYVRGEKYDDDDKYNV